MTRQTDLLAHLLDDQPHTLSGELLGWMETSARFTDFADAYRDKIRKKIRVARESGSLLDLRSELVVAYCLLNDPRLSVAYEPYASEKRRGPDYAVTYRSNLTFNIEVTRLRSEENGNEGLDLQRYEDRILRILRDKMGQMQPGMANLLVIHVQAELARTLDLRGILQAIKARADAKDTNFYSAIHYDNPAAFYKDFIHLSGILVWSTAGQFWINKQARPVLPEKVLRLVNESRDC